MMNLPYSALGCLVGYCVRYCRDRTYSSYIHRRRLLMMSENENKRYYDTANHLKYKPYLG